MEEKYKAQRHQFGWRLTSRYWYPSILIALRADSVNCVCDIVHRYEGFYNVTYI